MAAPENQARLEIDRQLETARWHVCDFGAHDISKCCAIREFPLKSGHGHADYLLYLPGRAIGVVEAKQVGHTLKDESLKDSENLPPPGVIAAEVVEDLESALEQMRLIAEDLGEPLEEKPS